MDKWTLWIAVAMAIGLLFAVGGARLIIDDQEKTPLHFEAIALGTAGGLSEDNLSSFLLAPVDTTDFIALDAGNLLSGIRKAIAEGNLPIMSIPADSDLTHEGQVLQNIKAYLLTHAHLDHVAGLVINSPDDTNKDVLGLNSTIDFLRDHLFNWKIWPNFGDEGSAPLNKYRYVRLTPGEQVPIAGTPMTVEAYPLSHSGIPGEGTYASTSFLIESGDYYVLYFGDTGPDAVEESNGMNSVWQRVAPLVREGRLRGIFLEVSFPNDRPDNLLFGHLTPSWMMDELRALARQVDADHPETALRGLKVVVTHIKPSFKPGENPAALIAKQLKQLNDLGVHFLLPQQGQRLVF